MSELVVADRWRTRGVVLYLVLASIEGVAALIYLISIPGDAQNAWWLGLSKTRLAMAAVLFVGTAMFLGLTFKVWRDPVWRGRFLLSVQKTLDFKALYFGLILTLFIGGVAAGHLVWLASVLTDQFVQGYLQRLAPISLWVGLLSWQTIIILPLLRFGSPYFGETSQRKVLKASLMVLGVLFLLWAVIAVTGIGVIPDIIHWEPPGVPVQAVQVWGIWLLAVLYLLIGEGFSSKALPSFVKLKWFDLLVSFLIWIAAFWAWNDAPLPPAYFAPKPRAPNFEIYPFSDAASYDITAQRLLIGAGFPGIPQKPYYSVFLALAHALVGDDYEGLIRFQVGVLALMPVLVYWLAKTLHHRVSGLLAALFLIVREVNAFALSSEIRISHAKLLLSDMPTALGLILLAWLLILWLQKPQQRRWYPILLGGVLGILLLFRQQIVVLVGVVLVLLVILFLRRFRLALVNVGLFLLGVVLAVSPWLLRSYQLSRRLALSNQSQEAYHLRLYALEPGGTLLEPLPEESDADFQTRVAEYVYDYALRNPGKIARFISAHFAHSQVETLLSLPMYPWLVQNPNTILFNYQMGDWQRLWDQCCSIQTYLAAMPFWDQWEGDLLLEHKVALIGNLALLAIGLGVAWVRRDLVGWIPLLISLAYNFSTSLGRISGWRFLIPVDWVLYLYFAIGLGQLTLWLASYISHSPSFSPSAGVEQPTLRRFSRLEVEYGGILRPILLTGGIFLILGLVPLLLERGIQPSYAPLTKAATLDLLEEEGVFEQVLWLDDELLQQYLADEGVVVLHGRALYPRYYPVGEGESGGGWPAYAPREYSRLGFSVISAGLDQVLLPLEFAPSEFPNASDVVVIGCKEGDLVDALLVLFEDGDLPPLVRSPQTALVCPFPSP